MIFQTKKSQPLIFTFSADHPCDVFASKQKLGDEKMIEVLVRTVPKMGPRGQAAALALDLDGIAVYVATPVGAPWAPRITFRLQRRF